MPDFLPQGIKFKSDNYINMQISINNNKRF